MTIEHKKVDFEDDRGTITDIFVKEPKDHTTIIFTKKGGIRGNHFHKHSTQHDFIVSGRMKIAGKKPGEEKQEIEVGPYTLITWEPNEAHAFIALEDTVFLTMVDGQRGGHDYESDTFRLEGPEKLIS